MQLGDIRFVVQTLARVAIGQQLRDFRQDLEVLLGGLLGHEQEDQETDRLAVGASNGIASASRTNAASGCLAS